MNRTRATTQRTSPPTTVPPRALGVAGVLALATCMAVPAEGQMLSMPQPEVDWVQRLGETVPGDVRLTASDGAERTLGELVDGRPVVLALVYYECPMLCNLVLDGLTRSLAEVSVEVGEEFEVLVVSIDPDETPAMAAERRAKYLEAGALAGDPAGWHFLVGEQAEIRRLAGAVGFAYSYVPETDEYAHAAGVTVLTPDLVVSRVLFGVEYDPRDVKFALMDASDGAIGSTFDKVLLRCFAYDPEHGAYGFAIMTTIRIAGIGTLLVLGAFVLRALRRERGAAPSPLEAPTS